jgi:hypothetical protein
VSIRDSNENMLLDREGCWVEGELAKAEQFDLL